MNLSFKNLYEVCDILDSRRIPITASERKAGPFPYYGANGVQDYVADYIFDDELVLLAEDGGNFGSKERPIAYRVSGKCWVNNHAHVLKPLQNINVDYLCYALMFYDTSGLVNGATRQKLTQAAMRQMRIPVRDMATQLSIVKKINGVFSLISLRQEQLKKIELLAKSRFIEMFGNIAEKVPLSYYISELRGGKSLAGDTECANKVLCTGSVSYDFFNGNDVKNLPTNYVPDALHKVNRGDILISRMNTVELVGAAAYVFDAPLNTYIPDRLWKVIIADGNNPIFVWQVLIQPATKEKIRSKAGGTSGSMKNISKGNLLNIEVPQANKALQNEFAAFVEQLDKSKFSISRQQKMIDSCQRGIILHLTGRL